MSHKTLHLNLHRKWFDMILSGDKKEEYREVAPYWFKRFLIMNGEQKKHQWWKRWWALLLQKSDSQKAFLELLKSKTIEVNSDKYDSIIFSNGYQTTRDQFKIKVGDIRIKNSNNPEWGAVPGELYFVIELKDVEWVKSKSNVWMTQEEYLNDIELKKELRKQLLL